MSSKASVTPCNRGRCKHHLKQEHTHTHRSAKLLAFVLREQCWRGQSEQGSACNLHALPECGVHALEYADACRDAHDLHTAAFLDTRRRNWLQAPQVRVLDCLACVRSAAGYRRGLRDSAQVRVSDGDMATNKTFFVRAANSPLSASLWLFLTLPSV